MAWGYNAYSLGIDGKDEFGRFLPHDYLESYGDFKPPVYAYLDILPIKFFGLTEFAVRFPSALFGTLTVLLTFFLVKEIFGYGGEKKQKETKNINRTEILGLLCAGILAVSPWHIMLSRAAFEANVGAFFIILGVFLFLLAIRKNTWFLSVSAISFVVSIYTFNSPRVVAPLIVFALTIGCWKTMWKYKKQTIVALVVGILFLLPTLPFLLSPQASLRFKEVNIFSDLDTVKMINQEIANDGYNPISKIIHNRRIVFAVSYLKHFLDNFDPNFLFIKGDKNPRFSTQDVGELYIIDLPFFIIGIILLFKRRKGYWWIIPIWLLAGIVPAAFARETPHALRIESSLPTFQILVAYGVFGTGVWLRAYHKRLLVPAIGVYTILYIVSVSYFLHGYFSHYAREYSGEWQYGYKESVSFVNKHKDTYTDIYVTSKLGRPYIYYLFYGKISPEEFRNTADITRDAFGFVTVNKFLNYHFTSKNSPKVVSSKNLYIDTSSDVPLNAKKVKQFYLLNGEPVLEAYTL